MSEACQGVVVQVRRSQPHGAADDDPWPQALAIKESMVTRLGRFHQAVVRPEARTLEPCSRARCRPKDARFGNGGAEAVRATSVWRLRSDSGLREGEIP